MFAPMTWNEYYRYYLQQLQSIYSLEEATAITALIFENKAGITRAEIVLSPGEYVNGQHKSILDTSLQQLLQHIPVQYITGATWFYNLRFKLNQHVLIPRPETEELVKWLIDEDQNERISILDIGTGSGCIPVALKKYLPKAIITSIDLSRDALSIANENAAANNVSVEFIQLDFLNQREWGRLGEFDIIISNPPYIPASEKTTMDKNVTAYEPHLALFVPDDQPLLFYEKILAFAKTHLKQAGKIYLEVHEDLAKETAAVFLSAFKVEIKKDINGKERMIRASHFL